MSKLKSVLHALLTLGMLVSTFILYDNQKPVLDYMRYLPVYRVEQLWERREEPQGNPRPIQLKNAFN